MLQVNGTPTIVESYRYDAFGKPTINGGALTASAYGNRFMFTGREYVSQFSVYEYRNRAYHPILGRFMSEDPKLFDAGDFNLFRYCVNDPLNRTDPMGLEPVTVSPELDRVSIETVIQCLQISNSDGKGQERERAKWVGEWGSTVRASDETGVGQEKSEKDGSQEVHFPDFPWDPKNLGSLDHNHTNSQMTNLAGEKVSKDGFIMSKHDMQETGDRSGKPVYVIDKSGKIIERYRPSDDIDQRKKHADWKLERRDKDGKWKEVARGPAIPTASDQEPPNAPPETPPQKPPDSDKPGRPGK